MTGTVPTGNGPAALNAVASLLDRHVAFTSPEARDAVTLWAAHTHLLDTTSVTPRLLLSSPERGSGKTRCLEVLKLLVPNPIHAVQINPAPLFRTLAGDEKHTILLDEADTIFGTRGGSNPRAEELRAIINGGWERGASVPRCVGNDHRVDYFPIFGAIAVAGIGKFPDTILDRSIHILMKRRKRGQTVEPLQHHTAHETTGSIREALAAWTEENRDRIAIIDPKPVADLFDRPWDIWRPLTAIAHAAGDDWPNRVAVAARTLESGRPDSESSLTIRLLADIRTAFAGRDRITTSDLLYALAEIDESRWSNWNGRDFTGAALARLLQDHQIQPKPLRNGDSVTRGYLASSFQDAWDRYLPPLSGQGVTTVTGDITPL